MKFRFPGQTFYFPFDPKIIGSGTVKLKRRGGGREIIQTEGANEMPQRREIEDVEDKKEYAYIYIPARFRADRTFYNFDGQFSNLI